MSATTEVSRDLHQVGYEVMQLLDNPSLGSPQKLRELFMTWDVPAVLCERDPGRNPRDFKSLGLYEHPQQRFQQKIGAVLTTSIPPQHDDGEWYVQKMGHFIDVDLMVLDAKYCRLFGTRKERAIEVGFTLLVSRTLRISGPEALDLLQRFKQKCQQSHAPGLHMYASTTSATCIGAVSPSNPLCDPLTSFLDRFGEIAADRSTTSRGSQILKLLQQVQSFYFHRRLSFLRVLKKLFLTAKEYMDEEDLESRYDDKASSDPRRRTAALVFQAVRDQFVAPAGGRARGNKPLQGSRLWQSWMEARDKLLPRSEQERKLAHRTRRLFKELVRGREHWPNIAQVIPAELLALLKEYDSETEATGSCGDSGAVDDLDADDMRDLRGAIRRANAEGFIETEKSMLELLLLWMSMRSSLACGLAVLRKDNLAPRSFPSAEAASLQRFAWHSHRLDYRLLLDAFFPRGGRLGSAGIQLLPRYDGTDSLRCMIVLQASGLSHFMAWAHQGPLGDDLHPFNPLVVVPSDGAARDSAVVGGASGNDFDCWGVALAVTWRLLACFHSTSRRFATYARSDRNHIRRLLLRWDDRFNLDRDGGRAPSATGCINALIERCQTRDQVDPASATAPVAPTQQARLRESLWPVKRAVLRELVMALNAVDASMVRLSPSVLEVLGCGSPAAAPQVFGLKLWNRRAFRRDHNSQYRIRKCLSTFRALRGPPTAAASLLFNRILVFGYEVWQFEDPLDLRGARLRNGTSSVALHLRPDRRNRMEIVHLLATILPSYNSLPPRSRNGGMATLAAGGLMNSDVMKSFRKVDEMLRWIPYLEQVHDEESEPVELRRNDVMEFCIDGGKNDADSAPADPPEEWIECLITRVIQGTKAHPATRYDIRFQRPGSSTFEDAKRVERHQLRCRRVAPPSGIAPTKEERPMRFELKGGLLWENDQRETLGGGTLSGGSRGSGNNEGPRKFHAVRAGFPAGDPRSAVQSRNLWRDLFDYAEPTHVKAALLARNPRVNPDAPDVQRAARLPRLPKWEMFSSDGDDGGELGDVAAYFRLIASVLLCGASFPTAADNGFIAALQQDPDRAWYFDPSFRHILSSAESFYVYCWKKFLRQELPRAQLATWLGSCIKLIMACMHVLALRKASGDDSSDADALFTSLLGPAFAETVASIADFEANAEEAAGPALWEAAVGSVDASSASNGDDDASTAAAPRFVLTCQVLKLLEHFAGHFDQPSLLASGGVVQGQHGRGRLRNHFTALKQVWNTAQSIFRSVVNSFSSGELGQVIEIDDTLDGFGTAERKAMAGDDLSATAASPSTAAGMCVAVFRLILRRTSRIEEQQVSSEATAASVEQAVQQLVSITFRVRSTSRDAQELKRAMQEAQAQGVPRAAPAMKNATSLLHQLQQSQTSGSSPTTWESTGGAEIVPQQPEHKRHRGLFDDVEADGSSDAGFCIVGFTSFALLTNRWLMESVLRVTTLCLAVALRGSAHGRLFTFTAGGFHGHGADSSRAESVRVFTDAAANGLGVIRTMLDYLRLRLQVRRLGQATSIYDDPRAAFEDATIVSRVHDYARAFAPYFRYIAAYLTWDCHEEYATSAKLGGNSPLSRLALGVLTQLKEWCEMRPALFMIPDPMVTVAAQTAQRTHAQHQQKIWQQEIVNFTTNGTAPLSQAQSAGTPALTNNNDMGGGSASTAPAFLDLGRGNFKRFGSQVLCLLTDALTELEDARRDQAEACLNFAEIVCNDVSASSTVFDSLDPNNNGNDDENGNTNNIFASPNAGGNGADIGTGQSPWGPKSRSNFILAEVLAFPEPDLQPLFEEVLHRSAAPDATEHDDPHVVWPCVAMALRQFRDTPHSSGAAPKKLTWENFRHEVDTTPHIMVDSSNNFYPETKGNAAPGYFRGIRDPATRYHTMSQLFHKYAKFEVEVDADAKAALKVPEKVFDTDVFLQHWGLHWSFGQYLTTGSQWSLVSAATLLVVRSAVELRDSEKLWKKAVKEGASSRSNAAVALATAGRVLPLLRSALRVSYSLVNMQHDRIRLEVIKCHDASFIYSLAALATVPGTGEFLSLYGSENRKCIQGDEDGECVVRYSERLEVAGLALKLLAAKQLQLKDAVTSAASEVHQRYLIAAKKALDSTDVRHLADVLCAKHRLESNTVLACLQPSVDRQLQAVFDMALTDHGVDLNCYRSDTRFARYGQDYLFDVSGLRRDLFAMPAHAPAAASSNLPHAAASATAGAGAGQHLISRVLRDTLRVGAVVAQERFINGLRLYLTIDLGRRLDAVRATSADSQVEAARRLSNTLFPLFRNIADVLALRIDAQHLSSIFSQRWWAPGDGDTTAGGQAARTAPGGSVWAGLKDGVKFQHMHRVVKGDSSDHGALFFDVSVRARGVELVAQSTYDQSVQSGAQGAAHTVDVLDVVQLETVPSRTPSAVGTKNVPDRGLEATTQQSYEQQVQLDFLKQSFGPDAPNSVSAGLLSVAVLAARQLAQLTDFRPSFRGQPMSTASLLDSLAAVLYCDSGYRFPFFGSFSHFLQDTAAVDGGSNGSLSLSLDSDRIHANVRLRRDLMALLQSAVDHDLARGNLRVFPTAAVQSLGSGGGEMEYNRCGGGFRCGGSGGETPAAAPAVSPCGVCGTRQVLMSTLPSDARLYVAEAVRCLGDPAGLDPAGGSSGTGAASYRPSPLQLCEVAHPRLGDLRKLLVQELQLLQILVGGAEQMPESNAGTSPSALLPDDRSAAAVMEDVGRLNELSPLLAAIFHDLVLPLDALPACVLRCPFVIEIFSAVAEVFEAFVEAACRAAARVAVLSQDVATGTSAPSGSNAADISSVGSSFARLPLLRSTAQLNDLLSARCQAVVTDFLRFFSRSHVVQICARARLGENGRGYRPMPAYSILSSWEDCELHQFWCRSIVLFAAVPRWCRLSPCTFASAAESGDPGARKASKQVQGDGDILLWPSFVKACYEFALAHADVLHRVLPVITNKHRGADNHYDYTMSLRTFAEVDATLALFYELFSREHLRSWSLKLKGSTYETLEAYQATVLASTFEAIHCLVAFLRDPKMRWLKSRAYNKHERRSLIKNKILKEWKFLRYYLAIIVQLFPSINTNAGDGGGSEDAFGLLGSGGAATGGSGGGASAGNAGSGKKRAANSFDKIVIDAIYRALAKLLSIVCPELDLLDASNKQGSVSVDEDSMTVFFRHVKCGNNLPLAQIVGPQQSSSTSRFQRSASSKKSSARWPRDDANNRRKRTKKDFDDQITTTTTRSPLEPVPVVRVFDPSFQGCVLDDFAKLLEDCVHPRCAHDHERHGLDRYDESFDMMIKEFFSTFDRDNGRTISRDELLEPLERVIAALVSAKQLTKDATAPQTVPGQSRHQPSCPCISCALDNAISEVKKQNSSRRTHNTPAKEVVGEINYEDFALFMENCVRSNKNDLASSRVLYELIRSGGGNDNMGRRRRQELTASDIRRVLQDIMHANISDDMAEKMLAVADEDGSGTVSVEEFKVAIFDENLRDGNSEEEKPADEAADEIRRPELSKSTSWGSFTNSHEDDQAQQIIVDMVTHQSLAIFGLACLSLYGRFRKGIRGPTSDALPAKDWQNMPAKEWENLLKNWNKWTPHQFLRSEHKNLVCRACIKINVELYRLGYRSEMRRQNQIPAGWLDYTKPPLSDLV